MKLNFCALALLAILLAALPAPAQTTTLYNGALGTDPTAQSYLTYGSYLTNPLVSDGNQYTLGSSSITMDSTATSTIHSGFTYYNATGSALQNSQFPTLNPATGFHVDLTMKTISESHANNDRAGFSLIALDSAHQGVEIAFWPDEVWTQDTNFTHSTESTTFDTTAALTQYDLYVSGSTYTLSANNSTLLTGALRDYSASGAVPNVYALNNFLFFGDDTTSAAGADQVSSLTVTVPEPASLSLFALSTAALLPRPRRGKLSR
jgi:hypothetical protein